MAPIGAVHRRAWLDYNVLAQSRHMTHVHDSLVQCATRWPCQCYRVSVSKVSKLLVMVHRKALQGYPNIIGLHWSNGAMEGSVMTSCFMHIALIHAKVPTHTKNCTRCKVHNSGFSALSLSQEPLKHAAHKRMNCSVWHSTCAMPQRTILLQARSVDALPLGCRRSCPNLLHTCA